MPNGKQAEKVQGQKPKEGGQPQKSQLQVLQEATEALQKEQKDLVEAVLELAGKVEAIEKELPQIKELAAKGGKPKGLFGGRRQRTPVKDAETGVVYPSKSMAGQQLCGLVDGDPADHFAYYKLVNQFPDRFVEASEEEAKAAEAEWRAQGWVSSPEEEAKKAEA